MRNAANTTSRQIQALNALWELFADLPTVGHARCVGITKAVKLVTEGRVGPALDSQVRQRIEIREPRNPVEWIEALRLISTDILGFEQRFGVQLEDLIDAPRGQVHVGRVYDMVFGPRDRSARTLRLPARR